MKFYIATRLEQHAWHNEVRDALVASGHEITYDWTTHGPVWRHGKGVIRQTAIAEMQGVEDADFVVVLLPGGRGTHAELGMALAFGKPVLIVSEDPKMFEAAPETCAFYHHPNAYTLGGESRRNATEVANCAIEMIGDSERCLLLANDNSGERCGIKKKDHYRVRDHEFDGPRERLGQYAAK